MTPPTLSPSTTEKSLQMTPPTLSPTTTEKITENTPRKSPPRSPLEAEVEDGDNVQVVDVDKLYKSLTDGGENDHRYIIFSQFLHCVFYFDFMFCCYLCSVVVEVENT